MQGGHCTNARRVIRLAGESREVQCLYAGNQGIDTYMVEQGKKTYKYTDANSCPPGTDIWVPRSQALLEAVVRHYGFFTDSRQGFNDNNDELVGIYGRADGCGGCHDADDGGAMNSGSPDQKIHWTSVGPSTGAPAEPWFLRNAPYSEPNGDYDAGCWLRTWHFEGEGLRINDGGCTYGYKSYVCSSNDWYDVAHP